MKSDWLEDVDTEVCRDVQPTATNVRGVQIEGMARTVPSAVKVQ